MVPFARAQISIPEQDTPYCLWHVDKTGEGPRELVEHKGRECDTGPVIWGSVKELAITIRTRNGCNQESLIPDGSVLREDGQHPGRFVRRTSDGFGIYSGGFTLGPPGVRPLFVGWMELYEQCGTHQPPVIRDDCAENCDQHIEGWLVGEGQGALQNYALHLAIAGQSSNPKSLQETLSMNLNGVLIQYAGP